jgi:hypothetical protein
VLLPRAKSRKASRIFRAASQRAVAPSAIIQCGTVKAERQSPMHASG